LRCVEGDFIELIMWGTIRSRKTTLRRPRELKMNCYCVCVELALRCVAVRCGAVRCGAVRCVCC